jgi:single-strand DNA-binding protein
VARFSLATNERYYNPNTNESDVRVEWHRIVVWGKLAEFCEKYLNKGKQILLEGKIRTRSWQDREGNKRYTTEIEARNIVLLGKREDAEQRETFTEPTSSDFPEEEKETKEEEEGDDDVPF